MTVHLERLQPGQSRFHIGGNILPGVVNRTDRQTLRVWYVTAHFFRLYVWISGSL